MIGRARLSAVVALLLFSCAGLAQQPKTEPKKQERVRIGIAPVRNLTAEALSVNLLAVELRQELMTKTTDAEILLGATDEEIKADAEKKKCDYILFADVDLLRRSGPLGRPTKRDIGEPDEPSANYVGRLHFRLIELANEKTRLDQKVMSAGRGFSAQDTAINLTHSVRTPVLRALGIK